MVVAAGQQAEAALEELCRMYWYPLYAYARRRGQTKEDAEDLTQTFLAGLVQKNSFTGLQPARGRFRAFLLAAFKNFLANEWDKSRAQKRGGGTTVLSLDWQDADTRYRIEPTDNLSADKLYDRAWAVTLLERVVKRLGDECATEGKVKLFEQLRPCLMLGKRALPYAQAAAALGLSEGAVRVAVHRFRQRYRRLLREEIAQTLADAAQVEEELQSMFRAFAD